MAAINQTDTPSTNPDLDEIAAHARHRAANLVQLLTTLTRMRMQRTRDAEARRQLAWLVEAMAALGVLQRRLWSADSEDFSQFLAEMDGVWRRRCAGRPIVVVIDAEPVAAPEQLASALALIVNELVTNAIDHAFPDGRPGQIRIRLETLDGARARLTVADDGQGYEPEAVGSETLGLWLVRGLTTQLRGELNTTTNGGVTARLEFPNTLLG